jgi:spermidine synthase
LQGSPGQLPSDSPVNSAAARLTEYQMSALFEELDYRPTRLGALSLRRRRSLSTGHDIYEIKLDDEYLMSSQFTASEVALARLGLEALTGEELDVVIGGLGLGYTAQAILESARIRSMLVIDALAEVIEWHQRGLLPLGPQLTNDPRCRMVVGDFFMGAASPDGFDPERPGRRFHAILVDIDHSPSNVLHPSHAALYSREGLSRLSAHLHPGGVFALWSNDPPDHDLTRTIQNLFTDAEAHVVSFDDAQGESQVSNTVYIGKCSL